MKTLVLRRVVVPLLTVLTSQDHFVAHCCVFLSCVGDRIPAPRSCSAVRPLPYSRLLAYSACLTLLLRAAGHRLSGGRDCGPSAYFRRFSMPSLLTHAVASPPPQVRPLQRPQSRPSLPYAPVVSQGAVVLTSMPSYAWVRRGTCCSQRCSALAPSFAERDSLLVEPPALFENLSYNPSTNRPPTLTNREPQLRIHRNRSNQFHFHLNIVARHHHLHALR